MNKRLSLFKKVCPACNGQTKETAAYVSYMNKMNNPMNTTFPSYIPNMYETCNVCKGTGMVDNFGLYTFKDATRPIRLKTIDKLNKIIGFLKD